MENAVFSLGTNLGDRGANMQHMEQALCSVLKSPVACSILMETEPVDVADSQQWYYNRILSGAYDGTAEQLLVLCQEIEKKLGRERPFSKAPRIADIDILIFGKNVVATEKLTIPHPALFTRRFCIEGLYNVNKDLVIPGHDRTIKQLYETMTEEIRSQQIRFL